MLKGTHAMAAKMIIALIFVFGCTCPETFSQGIGFSSGTFGIEDEVATTVHADKVSIDFKAVKTCFGRSLLLFASSPNEATSSHLVLLKQKEVGDHDTSRMRYEIIASESGSKVSISSDNEPESLCFLARRNECFSTILFQKEKLVAIETGPAILVLDEKGEKGALTVLDNVEILTLLKGLKKSSEFTSLFEEVCKFEKAKKLVLRKPIEANALDSKRSLELDKLLRQQVEDSGRLFKD